MIMSLYRFIAGVNPYENWVTFLVILSGIKIVSTLIETLNQAGGATAAKEVGNALALKYSRRTCLACWIAVLSDQF